LSDAKKSANCEFGGGVVLELVAGFGGSLSAAGSLLHEESLLLLLLLLLLVVALADRF
jgi:hypothetical protein